MSEKPKIVIIDYGVGNLHSISRAFNNFDVNQVISEDAGIIENADGIVLPGVGSFKAGMRGLELRGLVKTVKRVAGNNKPILGICLGAQLMLSDGHEFGITKGLDIIKGRVVKFPELKNNEKVPHIGWNTINSSQNDSWRKTILKNVKQGDRVYFVHSFVLRPDNKENILAMTEYGGYKFCSAIKKGNIYGCQFHPEKSGEIGLGVIHNFVNEISQN